MNIQSVVKYVKGNLNMVQSSSYDIELFVVGNNEIAFIILSNLCCY